MSRGKRGKRSSYFSGETIDNLRQKKICLSFQHDEVTAIFNLFEGSDTVWLSFGGGWDEIYPTFAS